MPGMRLDFHCPCGFNAKNIPVGATQSSYYLVVLCFECHRLFSVWKKGDDSTVPSCKRCSKLLMLITSPGAWSPFPLHDKFPNSDPWLITEKPSEIRILCPKCRNYSVEYDITQYWDD